MTEAEREKKWLSATNPKTMLEQFRRRGSGRKLRLMACAWCRLCGLAADDLSRMAVEVAERFADDEAANEERLAIRLQVYRTLDDRSGVLPLPGHCSPAVYQTVAREVGAIWTAFYHLHKISSAAKNNLDVVAIVRDIFSNPYRSVAPDRAWLTSTVVPLAQGIYADRAFDRLPILADALQDAGCEDDAILPHCRGPGPHVRGCWVVDLVLGKQ